MDDDEKKALKLTIKILVFFILGLSGFFLVLFGSFYTIPSGYGGVLLTFGKADNVVKEEGVHFKFPFIQRIIKMEVRTQKYEAPASAASKDLQIVTATITTNYHLIPEEVPEIFRTIGLDFNEKVIQPTEQEAVKSITAKFTAEELITRRDEVRFEIKKVLEERLRPRGIIVEDVSIVNFDFSKSFNEAIEAKVTAEQLKLKADRDLERIKIEAEQKIASASAEAESLRLQREQVTEDLIKLREIEVQRSAIEKWNGILPSVTGGALPFINVK